MRPTIVDTVIISDVHIGSNVCRAKALIKILHEFRFKRLILNGDIFDNLDITNPGNLPRKRLPEESAKEMHEKERKQRLQRSHIKILEYISGLSKPENNCEIIWIEGNHDEGLGQFASIFGATVYWVYSWEFRNNKFIAIHGDQFDNFYQKYPLVVEFFTWAYHALQLTFPRAYRMFGFLKRSSKHYTRAIDCVANGALAYARKKGATHIFCGHIHFAEHRASKEVHYFNSGSWTEHDCSLIAINEDSIKIYQYHVNDVDITSKKNVADISL